jgi:hypothetical protein
MQAYLRDKVLGDESMDEVSSDEMAGSRVSQ